MAFDTTELREQREKTLVDSRALIDKADEETRALSAEERSQYDKLWKDAEKLHGEIEDHERRNRLEQAEEEQRLRQQDADARRESEKEEQRDRLPLRTGDEDVEVRSTDEYHQGFLKRLLGRGELSEEEHRAQVAGKGEKGGYLYSSEQFMMELLKDVDDSTPFRDGTMARKFTLPTADSLGTPTLTSKLDAGAWTSELGTPSRGSITFGKRALTPHPLAKEIPVSKVLIKKAPNIVEIVRGELARVIAEAMENGYMTGTGDQQPLGMFIASDDGIPTSRDVSTHNTATLIKADNLIESQFTLKQAYWGGARWVMHRDIMKQIAKLKDGEGQYLLRTGSLGTGTPTQTLLGFPVLLSEYAPNTATTGLYAYLFGDFNYYWIVDGLDMEIMRLEEIYARQNQDLFIIRAMGDGAPVRAESFVRGKFG